MIEIEKVKKRKKVITWGIEVFIQFIITYIIEFPSVYSWQTPHLPDSKTKTRTLLTIFVSKKVLPLAVLATVVDEVPARLYIFIHFSCFDASKTLKK